MNIGDKVTWESQSGGSRTQKTGYLIGFIEKNEDGSKVLDTIKGVEGFSKMNRSRVKFQSHNMVYRRALVDVPRGGKSVLMDYYAPNEKLIKPV